MTTKDYEDRMKRIRRKNKQLQMKENLDAAKYRPNKNKISTSKLVLWIVMGFCLEILIFSQYCCLKFSDTSFLYALLAIPAALIPTVISYMNKSKAENTGPNGEGIVWQNMMNDYENRQHYSSTDDNDSVG